MKTILLQILIILILSLTKTVWSQEMDVPVPIQYSLFLKILTFDRNLEERSDSEIVIGIVYQEKYKKSLRVKEELVKVIKNHSIQKIKHIPIRYVLINIDKHNIEEISKKAGVNLLYVAPLRAFEIKKIVQQSRQHKWMTLSGVTDYIESGLSVGLTLKGKKPQILINLKAARNEGVNFNSQLLKLAKIIE